jgi:hypothetical protein
MEIQARKQNTMKNKINAIKFILLATVLGLVFPLSAQTPGALGAIAGNPTGNQIYVNQITTGGDTTLIQNGASNRMGSFALPSNITGDNIFFEMRQIGDGNSTDFSIIGANNLKLLSAFAGNNNEQRLYFNGANNNMNFRFDGNANKLWISNDTTVYRDGGENTAADKATLATSDLQIKFAGNNNLFAYATTNGLNNYLKYDVTGNSNSVKTTQIGSAGTGNRQSGHYQDVTILGGGNDVMIYQQGTVQQYFQYSLTGSNNIVRVSQTATAAPTFTINNNNMLAPQGPASGTTIISNP